jgi:hypothetical protein
LNTKVIGQSNECFARGHLKLNLPKTAILEVAFLCHLAVIFVVFASPLSGCQGGGGRAQLNWLGQHVVDGGNVVQTRHHGGVFIVAGTVLQLHQGHQVSAQIMSLRSQRLLLCGVDA